MEKAWIIFPWHRSIRRIPCYWYVTIFDNHIYPFSSISLSLCPCLCPSVCLCTSLCLSLSFFDCLSVSVCLSLSLSLSLSLFLSLPLSNDTHWEPQSSGKLTTTDSLTCTQIPITQLTFFNIFPQSTHHKTRMQKHMQEKTLPTGNCTQINTHDKPAISDINTHTNKSLLHI